MSLCLRAILSTGLLLLLLLPLSVSSAEKPDALTYTQALQKVIDTYPTLDIARLQVEQARQEFNKVESTLGWALAAQGGLDRDLSLYGSPSDVADALASIDRTLRSGDRVGVSGSYRYEDSTVAVSPLLPNPSENVRLNMFYRMLFGQGRGNPRYTQGIIAAEAGVLLQQASELAVREQLARQTQDLFFAAASVRARLATAESAVDRARRLKQYVTERLDIGLSEEKDILQSDAQLQARLSDLRTLQVAWEQQRTTLNRLMGRPWDAEFRPVYTTSSNISSENEPREALIQEAEDYSPDLKINEARMKQSEADLAVRRDDHKDKVDLVLSVGGQSSRGDNIAGNVDEQDLAGGLRLEYQRALDKRGFDAGIYQAQLNLSISREDARKVRDDLRYSVTGLLSELDANRISLTAHERRLVSEKKKVDNAVERFRSGRETTDRLIQFENEMQVSRLALDEDRIALQRRRTNLSILLGRIWQSVEYDKGP